MKTIICTIFLILLSSQTFAADRLVYNCPDNPSNVCVELFSPEYLANGGTIAAIKTKREAEGLTVTRMRKSAIPTDRTFRNAWKLDSGAVSVDMPKARIIHQAKIDRIKKRELKILKQEIVDKELFSLDATAERTKHTTIKDCVANTVLDVAISVNPNALKNIWPCSLTTE